MSAEARSRLAARQAALVAALTRGAPAPASFDAARLDAAAAALIHKRVRAVARAWPALARAMGDRFAPRFRGYAASAPLPGRAGPLADGRAFAKWLERSGELPEAGLLETLGVDVRYGASPQGLIARRGIALKVAVLPGKGRLVVVACLPGLGERWMTIPCAWAARGWARLRRPDAVP